MNKIWFDLDQFKPKSTFNLLNEDTAIEVYMSSFEEKLMKFEIQSTNATILLVLKNDKLYSLFNLKNGINIIIKVLITCLFGLQLWSGTEEMITWKQKNN